MRRHSAGNGEVCAQFWSNDTTPHPLVYPIFCFPGSCRGSFTGFCHILLYTLLLLALRGCLFPHDHSCCLVLLFSAPLRVERSSDDRRFCPATMSSPDPCAFFFFLQLRVVRLREVCACQNEFVCCVVFQGVQHESFTDLFGPPDLPLPSLVEKESSSNVSHRKTDTIVISPHRHQMLCAPLMTFVAQPN